MSSEIAAVTGTGAVAGTAALLITKLLGRPASELGELFADFVREWRLLNVARTAEKLQKTLKQRRVFHTRIPVRLSRER